MSGHLLLIAVGPVQDFIAQARRTRDLWYGSHLLSELARAGARALVEGGAELIFPALDKGSSELEPCHTPLRDGNIPPLSVANKLLARVPANVDPAALAKKVREAVRIHWRDEIATPVREKCAALLADNIGPVWDEQIDSVVEFAASWAALGDYKQTRQTIERAVAARKVLRDFSPWSQVRTGAPKSSLDGARETVLREARPSALTRKYRLGEGEQLDAVGLVKRAGGDPEQFVPLTNTALACWLELARKVAPAELARVREACRELGVSRVNRRDLPWVDVFPFDAQVLFQGRWKALFKELELPGDGDSWGREQVGPLLRKLGDPSPYVACLCADGDRMGRALDALESAEAHRAFSAALAEFARHAQEVVRQHRGSLIYAGGDDVLAFVPLPEALACADGVRRVFVEAMATACGPLPPECRPTLSVGLGVGHVLESMGQLLQLGRDAEREAKRDRNSLAILLDKRSGGTRTWRASWENQPVQLLQHSTELLAECLPSRKVYEIAKLLERLPKPDDAREVGWVEVLRREVARSLARIEGGGLTPPKAGLGELAAQTSYAGLHTYVRRWVAQLLIARTFTQAQPRERHGARSAAQ